ncbi:MAG: hypothetical protein ACKOQY_10500 [Bacteroidota bacterium]
MKTGSLVICVDDRFNKFAVTNFTALPVRDRCYVVRELIPNIESANGPPGIALEEIQGKFIKCASYTGAVVTLEVSFKMKRFREVLPPLQLEDVLEAVHTAEELVPV